MKCTSIRAAIRVALCLYCLLIVHAGILLAQTTWTGALSTAWNTAGNWTAGVPDAASDVTIPNVTNDPVISAADAVAKSVLVQSGGLLTIQAAGVLTINGSVGIALQNQGTVQNSGTITIGNSLAIGTYGIRNESVFNNNPGGQIRIDRVATASSGIYCTAGNLSNAGSIAIGANAGGGNYGLELFGGNCSNLAGGVIGIDRAGTQGLRAQGGTFTNAGTVNIGMLNTGTTVSSGIVLSTNGPFNNLAGGQVNISRAFYGIYVFSNPFSNAGTVRIGAAGGVSNMFHPQGSDFFYNNSGGILYASGNVESARFVNAGGTLAPGYSPGTMNFNASEDFTNSIMAMEVNGKNMVGVEYDRVNVTGTATLGGTLALNITYTPANGDQITIVNANIVNGTFSSVTGLPANWYINYLLNAVVLSYGAPLAASIWTGAADNNWNNANNWSGGIPGANASVVIPNVANDPVIFAAGAIAQSVQVQSGAVLTINPSGTLALNGSSSHGIWNQGTIANSGLIYIGNQSSPGQFGIFNHGVFSNQAGGQLLVDRAAAAGIMLQGNTFTNNGFVTIGGQVAMTNLILADAGTFTNAAGGTLRGSGNIQAANFTNAGGTVAPGYSPGRLVFNGSEDFSNSSLDIEVAGTATAGVNFDQVSVSGTATLGGTLNVSIGYTANIGDQVTILTASTVSGTFSNVTGLPAKWNVVYYPTAVLLVYGTPATTWTGAVSTAWNTAGNWTAGVPDAASDVTIPNVTNDPVISAADAVAKSVLVQSGGLLTIQTAGVLTLNGSVGIALHNQGTVQNSGTITIGNSLAIGTYGIRNESVFNNNTGGQIRIDRVAAASSGIYCTAGNLSNAGNIAIGANAGGGNYGLELFGGNCSNLAGGVIGIDRVSSQGLRAQGGTFSNAGTINIGMLNTGTAVTYGIVLSNNGPFNNLASGQVNISRAVHAIYVFSNPFSNAGTVRIGQAGGVSNLIFSQGSNFFYNNPGGILYASGSMESTRFVNAGGTLAPGYSPGSMNFNASEDFTNSIMAIEVNGKNTAGVDYDRVNVTGTATLGGTLALNINYTPANGDQVTIVNATAVAGTFSTVTGLSANWKVTNSASAVVLAYSDINTWTGAVNTDWNTAGNWSAGTVPNATNNVVIPNVANTPVINALTTSVKTLLIDSGATLTINANSSLTITASQLFNGTPASLMNRGTINNKGVLKVN